MWIDYTSGIRMKHLHVTNFLLEKKKKKVIIMEKINGEDTSLGTVWLTLKDFWAVHT